MSWRPTRPAATKAACGRLRITMRYPGTAFLFVYLLTKLRDIPMSNTYSRHRELSRRLTLYGYQYHTLNEPTIPDIEYDRLMRELIDIERQQPALRTSMSPSQREDQRGLGAFVTHQRGQKHFIFTVGMSAGI